MTETVFRTCPLCEAMCGLAFDVDGDRIDAVRPDREDVFSHGYICPKGAAIADVHNDPDRLRTPVRRTASGTFEPISWDEAFKLVGDRLTAIRAKHGADAIALYMGNPIAHNYGVLALRNGLFNAIGTRNCTSAGSQDASPRFAASYYLYGASLASPVPDIERTDYLLCLGANPRVSNGSFLTAPDVRRRLQAIRRRGGRVVVVDPRRTETAREADEHVAILPGGDAAFLLSLAQVIVAEGLARREHVALRSTGWEQIERRLAAFAPERVAAAVGIDAATIRRLAREFAAARTAAAYSRVGVCNGAHGTVASLATDVLNLVAGRVGEVGGAMFPTPPFDAKTILKLTKADGHARWRSRVRGLPETLGDLPAAILAEEMETPGEGQVRAFVTYAGNPVLSTPNGRRLAAALGQLEFMVSIDLYINETTRHADVILPPAWGLCDDHVDLISTGAAVRNVARWSPPVVPKPKGGLADWEIVLELIYRLGGGPTGVRWLDWAYRLGRRIGFTWRPESTVDLLVRLGPYGDGFLPWRKGLNLKKLKAAPHGIDLGPLEPGIAHRVMHRDGKMHLDVRVLLEAVDELARSLEGHALAGGGHPARLQPNNGANGNGAAGRPAFGPGDSLVLIGRRDLRSNNSWMHNVAGLVSGRPRCTLLVHPRDAQRAGVRDGDTAILESRIHAGEVPVRTSDEMREGVVSLPHGWGHAASAPWQQVAAAHAGVSINDWTDDQEVESVVGQSILNGVRVRLRAKVNAPNDAASPTAPALQR
ncbi:MAG: molybdopterin-dependent oxidoreductase [Planctomycetia bacterium]|nr:molybdopterin-dependent oxidoreductase [Planctomycetia bacterium]